MVRARRRLAFLLLGSVSWTSAFGAEGGGPGRAERGEVLRQDGLLVGRLERAMEGLARSFAQDDPPKAARLRKALALVHSTKTTGTPLGEKFRQALDQWNRGAQGRSAGLERSIVQDIDAILEVLLGPEEKFDRRKVRRWVEEIAGIRDRQDALTEKTESAAAADPDRLSGEQKKLEDATQKIAGEIRKVADTEGSPDAFKGAADKTASAADAMGKATASLAQSHPDAAVPSQRRASQDLTDAIDHLRKGLIDLPQPDPIAILRKIENELRAIREQERGIRERTVGLKKEVGQISGRELRGQSANLGQRQRALAGESVLLVEELEAEQVPTYAAVLEEAVNRMDGAVKRLAGGKPDGAAVLLEDEAIDFLTVLIDALQKDRLEAERQPDPNPPPPHDPPPPRPPEDPPLVPDQAQVRMLVILEKRVDVQVKELESERVEGRIDEAHRERIRRSARCQGRVADLARALAQTIEEKNRKGKPCFE